MVAKYLSLWFEHWQTPNPILSENILFIKHVCTFIFLRWWWRLHVCSKISVPGFMSTFIFYDWETTDMKHVCNAPSWLKLLWFSDISKPEHNKIIKKTIKIIFQNIELSLFLVYVWTHNKYEWWRKYNHLFLCIHRHALILLEEEIRTSVVHKRCCLILALLLVMLYVDWLLLGQHKCLPKFNTTDESMRACQSVALDRLSVKICCKKFVVCPWHHCQKENANWRYRLSAETITCIHFINNTCILLTNM